MEFYLKNFLIVELIMLNEVCYVTKLVKHKENTLNHIEISVIKHMIFEDTMYNHTYICICSS